MNQAKQKKMEHLQESQLYTKNKHNQNQKQVKVEQVIKAVGLENIRKRKNSRDVNRDYSHDNSSSFMSTAAETRYNSYDDRPLPTQMKK